MAASEDRPEAYEFPGTYVHLGAEGTAVPIAVTESFWPDLVSGRLGLGPGRLVSLYEFDVDWDSWEVHPMGDEVVLLISGSMDLLLEWDGSELSVALREPGAFAIVPRGTWHTAKVNAPSRALFITAGDGTQHRPA